MRVLFRDTPISKHEQRKHREFIEVTTSEWEIPAHIEAYHYLLLWTLEHKVTPTTRNRIRYNECWRAEQSKTYQGIPHIYVRFDCNSTNVWYWHSFAFYMTPSMPNQIFKGAEFYAECLIKCSHGYLKDVSVKQVLDTFDLLGIESPFPTIELPIHHIIPC